MRPRQRKKEAPPKKERVNEQIRLPELQVIDQNGANLGTISNERAKELAREAGLDLVEINPNTRPPICKIMDFGKYKYDQSKKAGEAKKKQHQIKVKEVRLTPKTEDHDLNVKIERIREFLEEGDKVQIGIQFKGREIVHKERGEMQMQRIIAAIADIGKTESPIQMQGRRMILMLAPDKKAQARRKKEEKAAISDAAAKSRSKQQGESARTEAVTDTGDAEGD